MTDVLAPVVDTVIHPLMKRDTVLQEFMTEPLKRLFTGGSRRSMYPAPTGEPPYGEFLASAKAEGDDPADLPGSDPAVVRRHLDTHRIQAGILVPLTRGLTANTNHGSAICAATNEWLVRTWLEDDDADPRLYGSVCVNPRDPEAAVAEIRRWAEHPSIAQIVVPMQVHTPYGQRMYHPIWAEAERFALPVAVRADGGSGLEFPPTPVGYPRYFIEYATFASANFGTHLASLITEGTFEKYSGLKFVFTDGGQDLLTQLIWRMDTTFPACRGETPWVERMPSEYLADHIRFTSAKYEQPNLAPAELDDWVRISRVSELLMYGSHFPHWTTMEPDELFPSLPDASRERLLSGVALDFYGDRIALTPTATLVRP